MVLFVLAGSWDALMVDLKYPIWAIKRFDHEVEAEVSPAGYPGFDHAIWYWWDAKINSTANRFHKVTWEAAMNRIEFYNQYLMSSSHVKTHWERLDDITWRMVASVSGNRTTMATLTKLERIENPESTYRWYRE